jgi:peptidyl-prolyl cis-trans isomerase D
VVYDLNTLLTPEAQETFTQTANGELLKPFYKDDKHIIVKKIKTIQPQTLAFDEVQSQVSQEYVAIQKQEMLTQQAKEYIPNFQGEDIGWLTRESTPTLSNLSQEESQQLVEAIFNSLEQTNFVNFKDKVVVFHIEDTKLGEMDQRKNEMVVSTISNYKSNAISSKLLEQLQNKYDVKTYLSE